MPWHANPLLFALTAVRVLQPLPGAVLVKRNASPFFSVAEMVSFIGFPLHFLPLQPWLLQGGR
jgi:hypothetical protein